MSELSAKSFLGLLQKSEVVPAERLKLALTELSRKAAGKPVHLDELTRFLIGEGLITQWHYDKLLTRKYKGFFLGQYKLLSLLGTGGMSTVYLAEHTLSGQRRAIKVLPRARVNDKSYLDRFLREGRAAASLSHPNIVRVYDLDHEDDTYYMVMEYVPGVDLHQKVQLEGPVPIEAALRYLEQAAAGLAHAHSKQIVHRDIKPANLLLTTEGTVKLLDLGLALLREEPESLTLMHNERVMGTADFLAPEQAINSHNVDPRADIYSLGCTFYFLLTAQPPFAEGTIAQRIAMHQGREPRPLRELRPDCPPLVEAVCQRLMKKAPGDRFQSCNRIIQAVEKCRQQLVGAAPAVENREPAATQSSPAAAGQPAAPRQPPPAAVDETSAATPGRPRQREVKSPKELASGQAGKVAASPQPTGAHRSPAGAAAEPPERVAAVARPPASAPPASAPPASAPPAGAPPAGAPPAGAPPASAAGAPPAGAQINASSPSGPGSAQAAPQPVKKISPGPSAGPRVSIAGRESPGMTSAAEFSSAEVGELAALPASRTRKRGRGPALKTNLVVGAIVFCCFLVLVVMVIFLAGMFGS